MAFLRFAGFSVVRAWQGFWRNAMMSLAATATVILMLVLLAALFIVISGLNFGLEFIESKVAITVRLEDDLLATDLERLVDEVEAMPGVASVDYVSPEEAMRRLQASYREVGETLDLGDEDSRITMFASLEINLTDPDASGEISAALADHPGVERVLTKQAEYDTLLGVINGVRNIGLVIVGLVGLVVLFMIINTIRIAVFSRASEIEIMRLVGASDSCIRWPFILEGVLCGLIGAVVTILLVAGVWDPIQPAMVSIFQMPTAVGGQFLTTLSLLLLAAGLGIGAIGSWISVRSYLGAAR